MSRNAFYIVALGVVLTSACKDNNRITAPYPGTLEIDVASGNEQYALPGAFMHDPLRVVVMHEGTKAPAAGVQVTWQSVDRPGAQLVPDKQMTGPDGVSTIRVQLGPDTGTYTLEATFKGLRGAAARFTLRATYAPEISDISPMEVEPGQTVTIRGARFSERTRENVVYFAGLRAEVTYSTTSELRVVVPRCMTTRRASVRVALGSLSSDSVEVNVRGSSEDVAALGVGESLHFIGGSPATCVRLPAEPRGAQYLVIAQNVSKTVTPPFTVEFAGLFGSSTPLASRALGLPQQPSIGAAEAAEAKLRRREQQLLERGRTIASQWARLARTQPPVPEVGDQRDFGVPDSLEIIRQVSAVLRVVTRHALIYEDRNAPTGGLSSADFAELARLFDDAIYPTDVDVFGDPSDIDGNGRVIILLSPIVNSWTPANAHGYIAGFFYSCDLQVDEMMCPGGNAEILYGIVPDAEGMHGMKHTREQVAQGLPAVFAHELQHMIHFNRRVLSANQPKEDTWLQEALAHSAEDVVASVLDGRGENTRAAEMRQKNYVRAALYLDNPGAFSIVDNRAYLEQRGGAWLLLKFLTEQYGRQVLRALEDGNGQGVGTITTSVSRPWDVLLNDWAIALYAASLPESERSVFNHHQRYEAFDLSAAMSTVVKGGYPLKLGSFSFADFALSASLQSSGSTYMVISTGPEARSLNLSTSGAGGLAFPGGTQFQLTVLRTR